MPASGHVRTIHTLDNGCNPPCQQNTADFRAGLGNFNKNLTFLASHGRCTRQSATWYSWNHMAVCQNLVPLVNIKIAGKWMFIPLKMVLIGIDPYPYFFFTLMDDSGSIFCIKLVSTRMSPTKPAPHIPHQCGTVSVREVSPKRSTKLSLSSSVKVGETPARQTSVWVEVEIGQGITRFKHLDHLLLYST